MINVAEFSSFDGVYQACKYIHLGKIDALSFPVAEDGVLASTSRLHLSLRDGCGTAGLDTTVEASLGGFGYLTLVLP